MIINGRGWTTKLANKRTYKKQIIKNCFSTGNDFSKVEFEISQFNDKNTQMKIFKYLFQ